ncbi:MAG: S41 family peptidase [Phycisphaerales bacterium]|nr:S41 family peptidase [Phycisphaerales bacterium]
MRSRIAGWALAGVLLAVPLSAMAAEDSLIAAYDAILRGDYDVGRAMIGRVAEREESDDVREVKGWVEQYCDIIRARSELKRNTLEWNAEQARRALAEGHTFLALSFAAQAAAYADDLKAFSQEPWVQDLTQKCLEAASELERQDRWTKAVSYYLLLERVHDKSETYKKLREAAGRRARIDLVYKKRKDLDERIRAVDRDLLRAAVRLIDRLYFQVPDFKRAALGAIDNLTAVAQSSKLREYLDGLANPRSRELFVSRLRELRGKVESAKDYGYREMLKLFNEIAESNRTSVELPEGLLIVEFLEGADPELDDYTSIIWPSEAKDFDKMMMGGFDGVGIQLGLDERTNRLRVVTPLENSPALEAGIQPDDLIVSVNGESTKGWTTEDAVSKIMGKSGTEVVLTILRPRTGQELSFKLVRRTIELTSVRGFERDPKDQNAWNYMLDRDAGIAYIRVTNFLPRTNEELTTALKEARAQGMRALVLDVRHNPGGLLDVVVEAVSNFLDRGEVVSTRGRLDTDSRDRVAGRALYKDVPLVVLVNEASASASEILAGALQDHGRAVVLGDRTFGKGSVQHIRNLTDEARIKLTTALYYLPSGRSPHRLPGAEMWGVQPDLELKLTPKELRRVIERERESYVIHNEGSDGDNKPLTDEERERLLKDLKSDEKDADEDEPLLSEADIKALEADPYEAPKVDPQLQSALLMLRVKLAANLPWPKEFASARRAP